MKGLFITLEGGEGAGKTSLLRFLRKELEEKNIPAILTRAPGATPAGKEIRKVLLDPTLEIDPLAELFLFFADRQEQIQKELLPALDQGKLVICDRFHDSTIAYQGIARGLGAPFVKDLIKKAFSPLHPELTLVLDIDPEEGIKRKRHQQALDRMEKEELPFHKAIRTYFRDLAKHEKNRYCLIDAHKPKNEVADDAIALILDKWTAWKKTK